MLTLGTQRDLTNDMLIKGIIDSVVTVNQFYSMLPFKGIEGNALAYNREGTDDQQSLVDTFRTGVSGINKDAQTFTRHSTELTTLIGDAQVNGLVQAVGSDFHDATAVQVAAKAKGIGRRYMNLLIHGNEGGRFGTTAPAITTITSVDLLALLIGARVTIGGTVVSSSTTLSATAAEYVLVPSSGTVRSALTHSLTIGALSSGVFTLTAASALFLNEVSKVVNGFQGFDGLNAFVEDGGIKKISDGVVTNAALLGRMDEYIDLIHDKDGMVDYIMMNSRGVRKMTAAFRSVGTGFDMMDVKTSSGGVMQVQSYRGIPIFRNDFVGGTLATSRVGSAGGDGQQTDSKDDIYVGTLDDGSMTHGICGLTAKRSAGMQVQKLGAREDVDADITRVKWYCGLAHFSTLGLLRGSI